MSLPSFSSLRIGNPMTTPLLPVMEKQTHARDFGRISIAYSEDLSTRNTFCIWDATPCVTLCLSIGMEAAGESNDIQDEDGVEDNLDSNGRGGRRKLTERTPPSLIDPGDFDPMDSQFSY